MNIESKKIIVSKSTQELFETLSDLKNFKKLMPDSIEKFDVLDKQSFLFSLKGMPEIALEKIETTPNSQLVLGAKNGKIPFILKANLEPVSEQKTQVQFLFEGNFNPMMAMMVKSPITKFIETLAEKMTTI